MIQKTDLRILALMIEKANRLLEICTKYSLEQIQSDFVISDAIQYEFEKLYEDSTRLSMDLRMSHPELHLDDLRGIRNRIAHDYESVSLKILVDTAKKDIPELKETLERFLKAN